MCLNPLKAFPVGVNSQTGKSIYKVTERDAVCVWNDGISWKSSSDYWTGFKKPTMVTDFIEIPCGHCIECRLSRSREWAVRMMLEASYHVDNYFLTLTYDDFNVPINYFPDPDTGEALPVQTLRKKDLQDFLKRLRARLDYAGKPRIRFYAAGEYGDKTHRPHYHLIVFGLSLSDLVALKTSSLGHPYYTSNLIQECWPYGFSMVAPVTFESCAYVARYCTKKLSGDYANFYDLFNIQPEFSLMSRRPGLARQYFEDHADEIYKMDEIFLSLSSGGKTVKPPHYFDNLYAEIDAAQLQAIKEMRLRYKQSAEVHQRRASTLSQDERLKARADLLMKKANMLIRPDI